MTKYKKRNVNPKKIKQGSKDYATEDKSNMDGNIHQLSSSEDFESYKKSTTSQDSSEILEKSRYNDLMPTEIKQSEDYAGSIKNLNVKTEVLKPILVRDSSTRNSINDSDTNIATDKPVSVVPSTYGDGGQLHPFLATMSLWQNFFNAWLRMCNEFFRYPVTSGETWFLSLSIFVQRK